MPKLHPLFAEWADPWWPQPMASAERAEVSAFPAGFGGGIAGGSVDGCVSRPGDGRSGSGCVDAQQAQHAGSGIAERMRCVGWQGDHVAGL